MRVEQVLVGVPTRGQVSVVTAAALELERTINPALTSIAYSTNHLSVFQARNDLFAFLLDGPWKALIMVDSDVAPPRNFIELVSHTDVLGSYDLIGAAYPVFQPMLAPMPILAVYQYNEKCDEAGYDISGWSPFGDCWQRRGSEEVDAIGFGCVAVTRTVVEAIPFPWFEEVHGPHGWLSDDIAFCAKAKAHGFKVGVNWDMQAEHSKEVELLALMQGVFAVVDDAVEGSTDRGVSLLRQRHGVEEVSA